MSDSGSVHLGFSRSAATLAGRAGVFEWDLGADLIRGCPGAAAMHGVLAATARDGLSVCAVKHLLHPDDRNGFIEDLTAHLGDREPFSLTYRVGNADSYREITARGAFEVDPDGITRFGRGVVLDCTPMEGKNRDQAAAEERALDALHKVGRRAMRTRHAIDALTGLVGLSTVDVMDLRMEIDMLLYSTARAVRSVTQFDGGAGI